MVSKSPPRLIGLCSPCAQSGKSEVAKRLVSTGTREGDFRVVGGWVSCKFAEPLKVMADALLTNAGVPLLTRTRMLEGDLKETPIASLGGATARRIMQTLGTEWGREQMGADFWVNAMMPRVDALLQQGYSVVIDDVRFENEAKAIEDRGGLLLRVVRPGAKLAQAHVSEGGLDGWTMPEIVNAKSLEALHEVADRIARGELY